ncbi:MAG: hypothetical protein ACSHX6_14395 [Akkermansiaceae bacterium]
MKFTLTDTTTSNIKWATSLSLASKKGFALITTIMVMSMLMVLGISMLSLSSVITRSTGVDKHQEIAQANARLAAMMALSQLQESLGPDRRVTASASILDESISNHKKNWTTVWNTSEWDVTDPVNSRDDNGYLTTLVSGTHASSPTTRSEATASFTAPVDASDDNWVNLVGEGTVNTDGDFVYAEKVDITNDTGTGSYAYWVGDEGVKARLDITAPSDVVDENWASSGLTGVPAGTGVQHMTGMESYTDYLPGATSEGDLTKFFKYKTLDFASSGQSPVRDRFHDLTTSHVGLLVDNRWGGVRRDLSTAFEMDIEEFGEIAEFNAAEEVNKTEIYSSFAPSDATSNPLYYSEDTDESLGYLYEIPVDSTDRYRGPTWDLLRNHYRTYKKERNELNFRGLSVPSSSDALAAHSVVPFSYNREPGSIDNRSLGSRHSATHSNNNSNNDFPIVSAHGVAGSYDTFQAGARNEPTVQKVSPELIRMVMQYGLARDNDKYYITLNPFFVIHNPYNHPIEFYSMSFDLVYFNFLNGMEMTYTDATTSTDKTVLFTLGVSGGGAQSQKMQSFRIEPSPTGNNRLEPGEIRTVSVSGGFQGTDGDAYIVPAQMGFDMAAGVYLGGSSAQTLDVDPDEPVTIKGFYSRFKDGYFKYQIPHLFTRLHYPTAATGGAFDLFDQSQASTDSSFIYDRELHSLVQAIKVTPAAVSEVSVTLNVDQIASPAAGGKGIFTLDMGLKDFTGDAAVMSDFNYRSLVTCPADYDKKHDVAPNWDLILSERLISELQITGADGTSSYWGEGKNASEGGSPKVVLFDLPYGPTVSLGALQHADTSKFNLHAMRSIGNSRLQVGQTDYTQIYNKLSPTRFTLNDVKHQFDTSWAANEALWDRFYFSGMNWGDAADQTYSTHDAAVQAIVDGDVGKALSNARMELIAPASSSDKDELKDYQEIGSYLGIRGAFNVNSTSVEAWKAILGSLSGREISYLNGTTVTSETAGSDVSPISRFSTPAGKDDDYTGFRSLDDSELDSLAEAIVEQVRERGPFMGLSDFVNRRLVSDETGEAGAIQAAIDKSNINSGFSIGSTTGNGLENSAATSSAGMARQLDQGDVLNLLGPIIATRSDTFVIRAYGDSKDSSGRIKAQAWCEMIVQRTPEWVNGSDEDSTIPHPDYPRGNSTDQPILRQWQSNPDLSVSAQNFGRRIKVTSFQWMKSDEI